MKLKTLCIIPARSGSKEIKNKNIYKLFKNETLLETSIKFAKKLKFIDKIIVSTDSRDYLKIAKKILKSHSECLRPKKLSKDNTLMIDVIKYEIEKLKKKDLVFDLILLLQPNCPFRKKIDFINGYKILKNKKSESVITIKSSAIHPSRMVKLNKINNKIKPFLSNRKNLFQSRQLLTKTFVRAGSMYFFYKNNIKKYKFILGRKVIGIKVDNPYGINIDDHADLIVAKHYAKNFSKK